MESWASGPAYGGKAHFVCICVVQEARQAKMLAKEMAQEARFSRAVNGFVASPKDLPRYGQLGCGGFIVFDKGFKLVSDCTTSFMEMRRLAFDHVDTLLQKLVAGQGDRIPPACPGEEVQIRGLQNKQELNGQQGVCVAYKEGSEGAEDSFVVHLRRLQKQVQVRAANLRNLSREVDEQSYAVGGGGGCEQGGGCGKADCAERETCSDQAGGCGGRGQRGSDPSCPESGIRPERAVADAAAWQAAEDRALAAGKNLLSTCSLRSVGVGSMDREHVASMALLKGLVHERGSCAAMAAVREDLQTHFAHEEQMFRDQGFGEGKANFSATKSHIEEHERLLRAVDEELQRAAARPEGKQAASAQFMERFLAEFLEHVDQFDSKYEAHMVARGVA
mmetsp:Transcript_88341/g.274598  ORF Transcript_88341/g.274598 Transcript_88341/m.274598 type:complete len:391 (+) Transcript_88341:207-1379(+)